jgi:hypothetical protein
MKFSDKLSSTLSQMDTEDTFDAELVAEWFMEGSYTEEMISKLSGTQMDAVAEDLAKRWDNDAMEAFDAIALKYL